MNRRLLLVDDEDAIREIARLSLERVGQWAVNAVSSGRAAIEQAELDPSFDAVLLDVMMPGLDGPSTLRALRQGPLSAVVPVIFLTAKLQPADRERLRQLGAAGVIAKPFDPIALPEQLDRILGIGSLDRIRTGLAGVWWGARTPIVQRITAIDAAIDAIDSHACDQWHVETAISEAHKLAGLLGTFGLERGTELARRIESGLRGGQDVLELYALSTELRRLVTEAEVEPLVSPGVA